MPEPPLIGDALDAVERLSGRGVLAFISNHHVGPDLEIELFLLQPEPAETVAADRARGRPS